MARGLSTGYTAHVLYLKISLISYKIVYQPCNIKLNDFSWFSFFYRIGGLAGAKGVNIIMKSDGRAINLGAKTAIDVEPGVSLVNLL